MEIGYWEVTRQGSFVFATYVHRLDPVLFQVGEFLALRWYGLSYFAGFVMGYLLLKRLAERKLWVLEPSKTADFIAAAALLGVFLGGRLGYILFYHVPENGWAAIAEDPLLVLKVWEGGMASHGGILGLVVFTFFYARKHKVSWLGLGDGLCVVAPIGLMCGRIANFINGELYGRVAGGVSWAVKFPAAMMDRSLPEAERVGMAVRAAAEADPSFAQSIASMETTSGDSQYYLIQRLIEASRDSAVVAEAIAPFLEPRHPSQLYEALLEGAVLFAILWWIRVRFPKAPHGLLTGAFFGLYATFRIVAEQFREPDAAWVIEGMLTQGQFLSLFMYLFAAAFLIVAFRSSSAR